MSAPNAGGSTGADHNHGISSDGRLSPGAVPGLARTRTRNIAQPATVTPPERQLVTPSARTLMAAVLLRSSLSNSTVVRT
jgi:hypothetical protein